MHAHKDSNSQQRSGEYISNMIAKRVQTTLTTSRFSITRQILTIVGWVKVAQ